MCKNPIFTHDQDKDLTLEELFLEDPDPMLGYSIPGTDNSITGADNSIIDVETHVLWLAEQQQETLPGNTHACWGFFPVVN